MITYRPLPFFNERKLPISMLVIHSMAHNAGEGIAQLEKLQLSAHYVVDYDGTVYQCVSEDKRAWHAGVAFWRGITDVNSAAIGIEVCHRSLGQSRFNRKQIAALTELCRDIIDRRRIAPTMIVGHSDVAPQRKPDPGKGFPWRELAAADIGIWYGQPLFGGNRHCQNAFRNRLRHHRRKGTASRGLCLLPALSAEKNQQTAGQKTGGNAFCCRQRRTFKRRRISQHFAKHPLPVSDLRQKQSVNRPPHGGRCIFSRKKTPGNPGSFLFSELFHHSSIIGNNGSPTLISVPSGSAKGLKSALKLSGSTPREASILRAVAGVSGYMASPIRRRHSRVV